MANFQPAALIEYEGQGILLRTDGAVLYDTTQGVRIWGNATQDNYSIGDTTTGGVDSTYGSNNLAFGQNALNASQAAGASKIYNVAIGSLALKNLASSTSAIGTSQANIAIGRNCAKSVYRGSYNVFIGDSILNSYTSYNNILNTIIIGSNTGINITSIAQNNVIIGSNSLNVNNYFVDQSNVLIGSGIDASVVLGYSVILGNTIQRNNLPYYSVYIGYNAGVDFTTIATSEGNNICIGNQAGYYAATGTSNLIALGKNSVGGPNNIVIGNGAGNTTVAITGSNNILLGGGVATNLTTGSNNIIIGQSVNAQTATGSNNIDILTNAGTTGIQFTNSSSTLSLKANLVSVPNGRFTITGSTTDDNIPITINPTINTTSTANIYAHYHIPTIVPTGGNLTGNAFGMFINPKYASNSIPNAASSHYSGVQIITGATAALTTAIPDVRGLTIQFTAGLYAATVAPTEYTHLRLVDPTLNGSTNTYNIYSGSNTATGKWNLYLVGTSPNHILSKVLLGSTTDSGTGEILQVTGTALISSNLKVAGTQINTSTQANTAWLATGTANSTTFLRGDGTWATVTGTSVTPSIARTFALMGA